MLFGELSIIKHKMVMKRHRMGGLMKSAVIELESHDVGDIPPLYDRKRTRGRLTTLIIAFLMAKLPVPRHN